MCFSGTVLNAVSEIIIDVGINYLDYSISRLPDNFNTFYTQIYRVYLILFCNIFTKETILMRSDAQKKADRKYIESGKCQYKTVSTRLHTEQLEIIRESADKSHLTISKFMLLSALYCIKNNIIFDKSES